MAETPTDASGTEVINDGADAFCFGSACTADRGDVPAIAKIIPGIVFIYIYIYIYIYIDNTDFASLSF